MTSNKIISIEELWRFYNLSANLICIAGNSEYFNHINPLFAQLLDFTEEELVSIPYLDLIHPDDREATNKKINELRNGKAITSFQNRYQMKSGNYKWLLWTANRSIIDGNIYAIGVEYTDKIMLEQKLAQENDARLHKQTGLSDSIKKLIADTMAMYPIKINFYSQNFSEGCTNKKLQLKIIEIIEEQLKNILRHAQATLVQINLDQIRDKLFLSVQDDGVGFNKATKKKGAGVPNIINQTKRYLGEAFIDTEPGKGCTLSVTLLNRA
jgi:PAS domain S-box-containing protein